MVSVEILVGMGCSALHFCFTSLVWKNVHCFNKRIFWAKCLPVQRVRYPGTQPTALNNQQDYHDLDSL